MSSEGNNIERRARGIAYCLSLVEKTDKTVVELFSTQLTVW